MPIRHDVYTRLFHVFRFAQCSSILFRHCEARERRSNPSSGKQDGLLRCARNDGEDAPSRDPLARNDDEFGPCCQLLTMNGAQPRERFALFSRPERHPIFAAWRTTQTLPKSPANPRNRRRQVPRRTRRRRGPTCSRSARRWRNCSIPRSTAAIRSRFGTGLKPPPDNSWDRRAGGEAAAHRARASTRGASGDVAKRDFFPPSPSPPPREAGGGHDAASFPRSPHALAWRGGPGGGARGKLTTSGASHPPPPTPPRRFAGGQETIIPASPNSRSANSRLPVRHAATIRRSIRSWPNSSASPPRRKTPPRWRGRRATRWRRSASPPPRTRWTR